MNWTGRISAAATLVIIPHLFCVYAYINTFSPVAISEHGIPIEIKFWDSKRTPLAHMVDVTNGFGLKVLAEHNFLNENNIAFSPYGLMGILVALYEGVDGESSYQIQRSLQLPWNRNIMRIGFRDIHRTLRTYFVPEEGFLAGLALNNENVTFSESYKKILRFYGFNLQNEVASTPPSGISNTTSESTTLSTPTEILTTTLTAMEGNMREDTTTITIPSLKEETTLNPDTKTTNDVSNPTTMVYAPTVETVMETTTTLTETTAQITSDDQTTSFSTSTITNEPTITLASTTLSTMETAPLTTVTKELTTNTIAEMTSTQLTETSSDATETTTLSSMSTQTMENTVTTETEPPLAITTNTDSTTASESETTLETLDRRKKSIVDFLFRNPPHIDNYVVYRSFNIGPEISESDLDSETTFLVNGLRKIQISYMHYDAVLEHAYLPHLEASALRLPLDSDRYYLLVVMPIRSGPGEIGRLLARMARESDLSDVCGALRPRRVRAIVPSFTVKGHVTLTTDLQKLGIRDVFEPRQRDFTPMTHQSGVYVRSIEQAVSVAIRKYQPDDLKNYVSRRNPVFFSATYPFLYFVMDSSIHVALMAGKMVDPLNTRIL